jgi:RNA polymerase sigma factor (sigma-70 family)
MSSASLDRLIREFADAASDDVLLDRFVTRRETAAFESLLRRHGPRVLAVCRRLLPAEDADDAFQATFLCLLRQAKSIRERRDLRGWLLTVANRVSMAALRRSRRRREQPAVEVATQSADPSWREACVILHEEIDRLPERFRLPLVLCYFEGFSRDEAAEQLGWSAGTVKGRLERGRQALKARLIRRGIALSVGALTLTGREALASVPPELMHATLDLTGGRIKPALAALLAATRFALVRRATIFAGILLIAGVGTLAGLPRPEAAKATPADPPATKPADATTIRGKIIGPDGKPFAGAKLSLNGEKDLGTSGADGSFNVEVPPGNVVLLAIAKDHGPAWIDLPTDQANVTLRLVKDDLPIRGRIVDLQGKPLARVIVELASLVAAKSEDIIPVVRGMLRDWPDPRVPMPDQQLWPPVAARLASATTDADGRFELLGLGRSRLASLRISGAGVEQAQLKVATVEKFPPRSVIISPAVIYPASFQHLAKPGRTVRGAVREKGSGKPLADVLVRGGRSAIIAARTDAEGRFELVGFPKGPWENIHAHASPETHFSLNGQVQDQPGLGPIVIDFELQRGIEFRGRVTNHKTGKPVPAWARYLALRPNPHVRSAPGGDHSDGFYTLDTETAADGKFMLAVLPGPGAVVITAKQVGYQSALVDAARFFRVDAARSASEYGDRDQLRLQLGGDAWTSDSQDRFHAIVLVNPPADSGSIARDISLEPVAPITIHVLDPIGEPLAGASIAGLSTFTRWQPQKTAEVTITDWNPLRQRMLELRHEERKLVGFVELVEGARAPLCVKLQPWAEVRGRLLDPDGKPIVGAYIMSPGAKLPSGQEYGGVYFGYFQTAADGHFRVDGLTPGVEYHFSYRTLRPPVRAGTLPGDVTLKPGESRDLGDITAKPKAN